MPSPVGHALAGVTIALIAARRETRTFPVGAAGAAALLAMAPDLDLVLPHTHRTATHSVTAVAAVLVIALAATRASSGRVNWRVASMCALAWGSHLVTDYFGVDRGHPAGLQLFWPWQHQWFIADTLIFGPTERRDVLGWVAMQANLTAMVTELLILGPFVGLACLWRRSKESWPRLGSGARRV